MTAGFPAVNCRQSVSAMRRTGVMQELRNPLETECEDRHVGIVRVAIVGASPRHNP